MDRESSAAAIPKRGIASVAILLALVLAVTTQLVTGFLLMAHTGASLLAAHLAGGVLALVLIVAEWAWLAATRAGRHRLAGFVGTGSGPAEWSEAAFLVVVTFTVALGTLLAAALRLGLAIPFGAMLDAHRALAALVVALYFGHSALAMRRASRRSRRTDEAA